MCEHTLLHLRLQFQDALYERALQCLPGSYKLWYSYLSTKSKRVCNTQDNLFHFSAHSNVEAISKARSFLCRLLWQVMKRNISSSKYKIMNNTFERALVFMHKYPRIWITYLEFLMHQKKVHLLQPIRELFDLLLRSVSLFAKDRTTMQFPKHLARR